MLPFNELKSKFLPRGFAVVEEVTYTEWILFLFLICFGETPAG
jgi:hypothetical protein